MNYLADYAKLLDPISPMMRVAEVPGMNRGQQRLPDDWRGAFAVPNVGMDTNLLGALIGAGGPAAVQGTQRYFQSRRPPAFQGEMDTPQAKPMPWYGM